MKKRMNIIFNMVIPTAFAYIVFFLPYNMFQEKFFEYRWMGVIPFLIVTGFIITENRKEWKTINQQG
ncbi:MAG: hypothetical protein PWQ37_632 [Candidatus Petromonas sp.]|jgi:hypothetical protein|nr:hypothetical protein [Candidatus Petromonas sp.]